MLAQPVGQSSSAQTVAGERRPSGPARAGWRGDHGGEPPVRAVDLSGEDPQAVGGLALRPADEAPREGMVVVADEPGRGRRGRLPGDRLDRAERHRRPHGLDQQVAVEGQGRPVVAGAQRERLVERGRGVEGDLDRARPQVGGRGAARPAAVGHAGRAAAGRRDRDGRGEPRVVDDPAAVVGRQTGRRCGRRAGTKASVTNGSATTRSATTPVGFGAIALTPTAAARRGRARGPTCRRSRTRRGGWPDGCGRGARRGTAARCGCA